MIQSVAALAAVSVEAPSTRAVSSGGRSAPDASEGPSGTTAATGGAGRTSPSSPAAQQAASAKSAERDQRGSAGHSPDEVATSRYLAELLAARATGASVSSRDRPARISPERLASLVSYLEQGAAHGRRGVDVTS